MSFYKPVGRVNAGSPFDLPLITFGTPGTPVEVHDTIATAGTLFNNGGVYMFDWGGSDQTRGVLLAVETSTNVRAIPVSFSSGNPTFGTDQAVTTGLPTLTVAYQNVCIKRVPGTADSYVIATNYSDTNDQLVVKEISESGGVISDPGSAVTLDLGVAGAYGNGTLIFPLDAEDPDHWGVQIVDSNSMVLNTFERTAANTFVVGGTGVAVPHATPGKRYLQDFQFGQYIFGSYTTVSSPYYRFGVHKFVDDPYAVTNIIQHSDNSETFKDMSLIGAFLVEDSLFFVTHGTCGLWDADVDGPSANYSYPGINFTDYDGAKSCIVSHEIDGDIHLIKGVFARGYTSPSNGCYIRQFSMRVDVTDLSNFQFRAAESWTALENGFGSVGGYPIAVLAPENGSEGKITVIYSGSGSTTLRACTVGFT